MTITNFATGGTLKQRVKGITHHTALKKFLLAVVVSLRAEK